jgi:hypothetical protein
MMLETSGVPATPLAPDEDGVDLSLANVSGTVFSESVAAAGFVSNAAGTRWRYSAPRDGGVYDLSIARRARSDGTTSYTVKVRLDADLGATDPLRSGLSVDALAAMVATVSIGEDSFLVSASWEPFRVGWRTREEVVASRYFGAAKRVFASSECYLGSLGGLGGADEKCQTLAAAAGLAGTFTAWLADAHDGPSVRLPHASVPYVLVDGSVLARDWDDLVDGTIATPIALEERGAGVSGDCGSRVWTNTSVLGFVALSDALEFACYEWTLSLFSRWGVVGDATATDASWTDGGPFGMQRCSSAGRLYCFER